MLVTSKELLLDAQKNGYAVGALNVENMEMVQFHPTPLIAGEEGICSGCGVATVCINYYDLGYTTGKMAVKILKGEAKIAEMPIEYAEKFTTDDFGCGFVRMEGGIILDFRIAWAMNLDTPGDTIIMGTKGSLRIPSTECWNGTVGGPMKIYHEVCGQQVETEIPIIKMKEGLFDLKIRTFLDAVKNGTPAPVPSSQILYNQAIIDGIAKSAECGREVEIVIPEI